MWHTLIFHSYPDLHRTNIFYFALLTIYKFIKKKQVYCLFLLYFQRVSLTSLAEERICIFLLVAQAGHYLGSLSKSKFKNISKQAEKDIKNMMWKFYIETKGSIIEKMAAAVFRHGKYCGMDRFFSIKNQCYGSGIYPDPN